MRWTEESTSHLGRSAKLRVEHEHNGKLYVMEGFVKNPNAQVWVDENEEILFSEREMLRQNKKAYFVFEPNESGVWFTITEKESPNYVLGYKRGYEDAMKEMEDLARERRHDD